MNNNTHFELPTPEVFGPQSEHVAALLERARHLTFDEASALDAALDAARAATLAAVWDDAWEAAWDATREAALVAAWDATWDAASIAAWDAAVVVAKGAVMGAAVALVVRDLIATEDYDTLTRAWREVIGPIHPDDPELTSKE